MSTQREQYRQYLQSADWRQKRSAKRKRRNRCAICGDTKRLDVHHLNYRNWTDVKLSDLRVLCRRCHDLAHDLMRRGVITFKSASHHARFTITKNAVRRVIGHAGMFWATDQGVLPKSWRTPSPRGGYTRAQLAEWGIPWPPPKGWKKQLDAQAEAFAPIWHKR